MASASDHHDPAGDRLSPLIDEITAQWAGVIEAAAVRHGLDGFERDDLVQRIRLRLWRALADEPGRGAALTAGYGYRAAWSAAIDIARERRSRQRARHLPLDVAGERLAAPAVPDEGAQLAALDAALAGLEQSRRIAVRLHLAGRHLRDIAELAGWTEAKARNILYRGLEDLRQVLEGR